APTTADAQEAVVWLFAMTDSLRWANWDHVTGDGPPGLSTPGCGVRYPTGVNRKHLGENLWVLSVGSASQYRMPDDAYTGRPFRLTMQIFPDGRCGVGIDGKAVWTAPAVFFQPRFHLMLAGNSVDTRMLIGR